MEGLPSQQFSTLSKCCPVTLVTGHGNRTVTLQVLPPYHCNVPLPASHFTASAGVTARMLTTQSVSSADIQIRINPYCNYNTVLN